MLPSCVNSGNEYVTKGEPKGGVLEALAGSSPPGGVKRGGEFPLNSGWLGETAQLTAASSLVIEPLDRRRLVSKTLNVDAVLAPYQFDVLMGDAQLLGISQQGDLM